MMLFFFKQKTAYEMRISDWSSDVCSSDLGFEGDLQAFFKHMQDDPARLFPNTDAGRQAYIDEATQKIDNIKQHLPEYFGLLPKADLVVKRVEAFREQDEIGRASCRERVCQSG